MDFWGAMRHCQLRDGYFWISLLAKAGCLGDFDGMACFSLEYYLNRLV